MSALIPGDLKWLHRICSHYKYNESALKMASLIERIAALQAQVARLTHPRIYVGTHYTNADVPERCPDCDSRDFISYGVTSVICKNCWLTAELDKAEAQVQTLRDALAAIRRILNGDLDTMRETDACKAG